MTTVPTEAEIVRFVTDSRPRVRDNRWFTDLKSTLAEDQDRGMQLLERLSRRPEYTVRAWVSGVAADVFQRQSVPLLLRLAQDRYEIVRSCALAPLLDLDPQAAKGLADKLRERLRRHRPDIPGRRRDDEAEATQIIWALARLRDSEAVGELRVYMDRPDSHPYNVRLASAVSTYLDEGEAGVARRVLAHDHEYVLQLCQVSWRCCSGIEVWNATRSLYRLSQIDARCRVITAVFLGARSVATSIAEHPFWRLPLPDVDFPRQ